MQAEFSFLDLTLRHRKKSEVKLTAKIRHQKGEAKSHNRIT